MAVRPAAWEDLRRVHTEAYLRAVERGALDRSARSRLGLPHHPGLLWRCRLETAGTLEAARWALETGGCGVNLAGGTHHAFPDRGLGYCVLNDVAVAIRALQVEQPELEILVIDTDAHQGNGTQGIFRGDVRVATYSIHVGRNYPAQKEPGTCDVPLPRSCAGADYLEALRATLPPLAQAREPDLIFWLSGADPYVNDRFGQLQLSRQELRQRDQFVLELCRGLCAPTVVLYGGGYSGAETGEIHAVTVSEAVHVFA